MLLILTSNRDFAADFLIVELIHRNLPYFRLNTEEIAKAGFHFSVENNIRREIYLGPKQLDLDTITAVWYRRALHPNPAVGLSQAESVFVAGELRQLAMGIVLNPNITWINPIDKVSVAEHKLYQLQVARKLGFRVPRTLVSRNLQELQRFVAENKTGTICKPIFHGMFVDANSAYSVYTRRVAPDSFDTDSLELCPVYLQEEVPRRADVQATFIGGRCFTVDITADTPIVDWRDPDVAVTYSASMLDKDTETKCKVMLKKLGLIYGAFDFVRTPEGSLVFLEINPTGEWAWLEERLGFPMREAFIESFYGAINES
jgi:hypothetical protein